MNLEAFLTGILTPLLDHPEDLRIETKEDGRKRDFLIHAEVKDRGRIIGKNGRMISSLRTLCQVAGEKTGVRVGLEIFEEEGEKRSHRTPRPDARPEGRSDKRNH